LALAEISARLGGQPGSKNNLDRFNLFIGNGRRFLAEAQHGDDSCGHQDWQALLHVKTAKHVPGKEGPLTVLRLNLRPIPLETENRQVRIVTLASEHRG
jgi:hypothetical protein